jgi:hypothetical protein
MEIFHRPPFKMQEAESLLPPGKQTLYVIYLLRAEIVTRLELVLLISFST